MNNQRINVLHVLRDLGVGGTQEVVKTLAKELSKHNCRPIVCAFEDGYLRQEIEKSGVKVEILKCRSYRFSNVPQFVAYLLSTRRKLNALIQKYNIEIVQVHAIPLIALLLLTLTVRTDMKVLIWTIHNVKFFHVHKPLIRRMYETLYRLGANRVSGIIAVSDEVRSSIIRRIGPVQKKISTIYNGVDVSEYEHISGSEIVKKSLGLNQDELVISTVATLTTQKGHKYLIDAASTIVSRYPNVIFCFIGDGPLKKQLQTRVRSLNLSEKIRFLGNQTEIPEILGASDFFVLPSLWEGLSIALLEAMAAAKPIVATSVSGTQLVMIPNKTGIVVKPGDSSQLATAIIKLISNPIMAKNMGITARKRAIEAFSAQKQAKDHMVLYRRLIGETNNHFESEKLNLLTL
jgi:glycosyltransferase involved in cell wall biosynthesis